MCKTNVNTFIFRSNGQEFRIRIDSDENNNVVYCNYPLNKLVAHKNQSRLRYLKEKLPYSFRKPIECFHACLQVNWSRFISCLVRYSKSLSNNQYEFLWGRNKRFTSKICLVHMPKTGGSFISQIVYDEQIDHQPITYFINRHLGNPYKIGVIRNPYDWYVSLFTYFKQFKDHMNDPARYLFGNLDTIDEYLDLIFDKKNLRKNKLDKQLTIYAHSEESYGLCSFYYRHLFFSSDVLAMSEKDLKKDYKKLIHLDELLKQESLNKQLSAVFEKLKIPVERIPATKVNVSQRETYHQVLSKEAMKRIREKESLIFDLYYPDL